MEAGEKMKLSSLLERVEYTCCQGSLDQEVTTVTYDSRKAEPGSMFICIRGAVVDGHKFIPDVVEKGAKVLVVEGSFRRNGHSRKRYPLCYGVYLRRVFRISRGKT